MPEQPKKAALSYFGDYLLLDEIARGGMGVVYCARQSSLDRKVAIKMIDAGKLTDSVAIRRFQTEAEAMAHLDHPNIVPIYEIGEHEEQHYFSMRFVDGLNLAEHTTGKPMDLRKAAEIVATVARAVNYAHARGVLHRDLKPSNILLDESCQPHVTDFGIAKLVERGPSLTGTMAHLGTPEYMAPEQVGKASEVTIAADIYGLGAVLYYLLTGKPPFTGDTPFEILERVRQHEPVSPRKLNRAVDGDLETICFKCLDKEPRCRYASAEALAEELGRWSRGEPIRARPVGSWERVRKWAKRNPLITVLSVSSLVALALATNMFCKWRTTEIGKKQATERAAANARQRELLLRNEQLIRAQDHLDEWSANAWSNSVAAAQLKPGLDDEIRSEAVKALAGLDARPVRVIWDAAGASAAFASDGIALVGGASGSPARLMDTNGATTELPVDDEGPVCWTPEGEPLQFVARSNACVLRELRTSKVRRVFPLAEGEEVVSANGTVLAITPDGRSVATATVSRRGGRVVAWGAASGTVLGQKQMLATALAFSPDGLLLAAGGEDGTVQMLAIRDLASVVVLPSVSRPVPVVCVGLARDRLLHYDDYAKTNRWLVVSGYKGGEIVIWDVDRRQPRAFCRGSVWTAVSFDFHPDGQTLASGGRHHVRLWDLMTGRLLLRISGGGSDDGRALAFSHDGTRLVWGTEAAGARPSVGMWELSLHRGIHALRGLPTSARRVWFAPNNQRVAAVSDDWHLGVWEVPSGKLEWIFEAPVGEIADNAAGAFDPSSQRFAFATGTEARLYELSTGRVVRKWRLQMGLTDQMQYDASGRLLLVRREAWANRRSRTQWRLYELPDAETAKLLHEQSDTNWWTTETRFAPGGERFIAWNIAPRGVRREIKVFGVADGRQLWNVITERTNGQPDVLLDPTGRWFTYTPNNSGRYRIVRSSDFVDIGEAPEGCGAIGPSGELFAVSSSQGWHLLTRNGKPLELPLETDWTPDFTPSFSADGKLFAWGTREGVVLLAELEEVERRLALLGRPK